MLIVLEFVFEQINFFYFNKFNVGIDNFFLNFFGSCCVIGYIKVQGIIKIIYFEYVFLFLKECVDVVIIFVFSV